MAKIKVLRSRNKFQMIWEMGGSIEREAVVDSGIVNRDKEVGGVSKASTATATQNWDS